MQNSEPCMAELIDIRDCLLTTPIFQDIRDIALLFNYRGCDDIITMASCKWILPRKRTVFIR